MYIRTIALILGIAFSIIPIPAMIVNKGIDVGDGILIGLGCVFFAYWYFDFVRTKNRDNNRR